MGIFAYRLYKDAGLSLQKRSKKKKYEKCGMPERTVMEMNARWSMDFVGDRTRYGSNIRVLTVIDEVTRECLAEEKQKLQLESAGRDEQTKRISDMGTFLWEQPTALTEYDHTPSGGCDALVRRLIEKVTVYTATEVAADKFTVEFKSGLTVDVDE